MTLQFFRVFLLSLVHVPRMAYGGSCDTANVWADCDNELYVYLKDESGDVVQIGHEDNWHLIWTQTLHDINASTTIEFKCVDLGVIGAFIATIEYNDVLYSTTNPITKSNFEIVEGDTSKLIYHTKESAPWHNSNEYIADDASWVWNDKIHNTMKFDFAFKNIISSSQNSSQFVCNCAEDCVIDCDAIDPRNGCSNTVIDGRQAASLKVVCKSSKNHYYGGCQMSTILCPQSKSSQCDIQCKDYYGCYLTKIYSSYPFTSGHGNVSIDCHSEEGSCLKTTLFANKSSNVDITCYGAGILGSKQHSSCDNFNIHAEDLSNKLMLLCTEDYSCHQMNLYTTNAHQVYVHARGDYALSNSYIYAQNAQLLHLFCGSEEAEFGCHNLYTYNPAYEVITTPLTTILCHGHGCKGTMYFYSAHAALDLNIALNGCEECNDIESCIGTWYFYCDDSQYDTLYHDSCKTDNCDCSHAVNTLNTNWQNNLDLCDIFTFDYECASGIDCVIDCMQLWPNEHGCYDKEINAKDAKSLTVICNSSAVYGGCESSHIYCPSGDESRCDITCNHKDACYDTEISVVNKHHSKLYLKCTDSFSCSHTNVYGAITEDIYIHCIATDSCDNINVTANAAQNVTIHCEGNALLRSYGACDGFNVFAANVTNEVRLVCNGDYSCYSIVVFANHAHNVIVDTIGNFGSFGGSIYAQHADSMFISCKSQYNEYGCYKMAFYLPSRSTSLHCEGHGCFYLELFAFSGFNDITSVYLNGCGQCSSSASCINHWGMKCGYDYTAINSFSGDSCHYGTACGCSGSYFTSLLSVGYINNEDKCNLIHADHACEDNKECVIDCTVNDCSHNIIFGNNASSITVKCGAENHCANAKIYCPLWYHSECVIECSAAAACNEAEIYGEADSILYLKCEESDACDDIAVDASNTFETTINCTAASACDNFKLYGDNAQHITVNCFGDASDNGYYDYFYDNWNTSWLWNDSYWNQSYLEPVCDKFTIDATHVMFFEMNCVGNDVCYPLNIDVSQAQHVSIKAVGSYSIYSGSIDARNAESLVLNFASATKTNYGVEEVALYVPPNGKTELNCAGFGCHSLRIYTENGMNDVSNISFFGCNHCIKPEICIQEWYLYCGEESTTFTGSTCDGNHCDCNQLKDKVEESFILDLEEIEDGASSSQCTKDATFTADFKCDENEKCVIDCSKNECEDKVIYAGKASSLNVICSSEYSCNSVEIYCPETVSECNLLCSGFDACFKSKIYGDHHNEITVRAAGQYAFEYSEVYGYDSRQVNVSCTAPESCYKASIYASKAHYVNIVCDSLHEDSFQNSTYIMYDWKSPCYALDIYASSVVHDLYLKCVGDYSCFATYLFATNAQNVFIIGVDGKYAMQDAHFYATNASYLGLSCRGIENKYGCASANIYLPAAKTSNINMKCYGFGCDSLFLYSAQNGMDLLKQSTTKIELNSCGVCSNAGRCVDAWRIYCNEWSKYDIFAVFDGVSCSKHAQHCNCAQNTQLLQSVFKPYHYDGCSINEAKTTLIPIQHTRAQRPHIHHTRDDNDDVPYDRRDEAEANTNSKSMMIFMISVSFILFLCVFGNVYYCYRKKMNEKIASEILQGAEEGGIEEIALEPMDANIGQQIVAIKDGNETGHNSNTIVVQPKYQARDGRITGVHASAYVLATQ